MFAICLFPHSFASCFLIICFIASDSWGGKESKAAIWFAVCACEAASLSEKPPSRRKKSRRRRLKPKTDRHSGRTFTFFGSKWANKFPLKGTKSSFSPSDLLR